MTIKSTPDKDRSTHASPEERMTAPVDRPGDDVNAELDPEVAARAEAQVAENERLEREAAYDNPAQGE